MIAKRDITGVVLCGGEGSRLGGADKPLTLVDGAPMVEHVRTRLAPQVANVLISCNRNARQYAQWGDEVVIDAARGIGPLAGILAALPRVETPYVFVCPGDAPLLPRTLVARLADALLQSGADVCVPHDGERRQHLFALFRPTLCTDLQQFVDSGGRSMHGWLERHICATVDAADESHAFFNVNTPADLAHVAQTMAVERLREAAHSG